MTCHRLSFAGHNSSPMTCTVLAVADESDSSPNYKEYCLCDPGARNASNPFCGEHFLKERNKASNKNPYAVVAVSDFCLEPPGDTPTRSHFYLVRMPLIGGLKHRSHCQGLVQPLIIHSPSISCLFPLLLLLTHMITPRLYWVDAFPLYLTTNAP